MSSRLVRISLPIIIFLLFVSLSSAAFAQDDEPWYPAPETLFAPGVQVEDMIVESYYNDYDPVTRPEIDNEKRLLRIFDPETEEWLEFSYPDEMSDVTRVDYYDVDHRLIWTDRNADFVPEPNGAWLLDIHTGTFTRPELICGSLRETRADQDGSWVIEPPPDEMRYQAPITLNLCHTKTLEQRILTIDSVLGKEYSVSLSPDGTKLALMAYDTYYIYDLENSTLMRLGTSHPNDIRAMSWYGNDYLMAYETGEADMGYPWVSILLGNISQADSLTYIATTLKPIGGEVPEFAWRDNPRRIEWVGYTDNGCYLNWLEEETGHYERFPLDDLCTIGIPLSDEPRGDRLFDPIIYEPVPDPQGQADIAYRRQAYRELVRYNLTTGARTNLVHGEIEMVFDSDPGTNYAAIILDDNRIFDLQERDLMPNIGVIYPERILPHDYQLAIVDLHTGEILYRYAIDTYGQPNWYTVAEFDAPAGRIKFDITVNTFGDEPAGSMFTIGAGQFLARAVHVEIRDGDFYGRELRDDRFVEVKDGIASETILSGIVILTTPENAHFVTVSIQDDQTASVSIHNRETSEDTVLMPIIVIHRDFQEYNLTWNDYPLYIMRGDTADEIEVSMINDDANEKVTYRVRVD